MDAILKKYRQHALLINRAGGRLYVVGGAVRDFVMRRPVHDVDLCVTGLTIDQFVSIFPTARLQGKQFPVFVVDNAEIASQELKRKLESDIEDLRLTQILELLSKKIFSEEI